MRWVIIRWYILQKKINYQVVYLLLINLAFSTQYSFSTLVIFKILGLLKNNEITFTFLPLMYGSTIYSFLVLLVWNLIYFSYHYIEKSRKALIEKIRFENELQLQKLESEKTKAEQKLESEKTKAEMQRQATELQIKAMVATQEQERKRISRDLHDDVGTKLSALNLFLSSLDEKAKCANNNEIRSLAQSSKQFIKEAMYDVRQLLLNLSPTVLEEFGYVTAVEGLVNKINETKQIHFDLVVFGINHHLKKEYELALYRITQELINNVLNTQKQNMFHCR